MRVLGRFFPKKENGVGLSSDYGALPSTEIEVEVPKGNLLGVMWGKRSLRLNYPPCFFRAWADPIGIDAATLRAAQQSPEK